MKLNFLLREERLSMGVILGLLSGLFACHLLEDNFWRFLIGFMGFVIGFFVGQKKREWDRDNS